jgi:predicted alpha/beta superfamily hydrolase
VKKFFLFLIFLATYGVSPITNATEVSAPLPPPFVLPDTEVHQLHAADLNRDYEIFVSLPKSYSAGHQNYPVVFVTDAPYTFPLAASIGAFMTRHSKALPEFILIGLSYAKGDTGEFSRRRDYTPSPHGGSNLTSDMPGRTPVFGEAEGYRRFLADQVFPFVASHYRADMTRKVLAGHSYGSLFGTYVLLTEPSMFNGYVLSSPSLWYDDHFLFAREREFAATHKNLTARVYIGAGSFEGVAPKSRPNDPRYSTDGDMVADAGAFAHALASRHYPGLHLRSETIADENHLTVAPTNITRGLLWTLGTL